MNNRTIIVITIRKKAILESIERVLKSKNNIMLIGVDSLTVPKLEEVLNLIKLSPAPILVLDSSVEDENSKKHIQELVQSLPEDANLILNMDDKLIKEARSNVKISNFTYGFDEKADFKASDAHTNGGLNFKLNYNGKIIPIWQNDSDNDYVYGALVASCIGIIMSLNLVEISELLKNK